MDERMITSHEAVVKFYTELEAQRQILKMHSDKFDDGQDAMIAVTQSDDWPQMQTEFEAVHSVLRDIFTKIDHILERTDTVRRDIEVRMSINNYGKSIH